MHDSLFLIKSYSNSLFIFWINHVTWAFNFKSENLIVCGRSKAMQICWSMRNNESNPNENFVFVFDRH